jgi:hypothetical protein
LSRDRIRSGVSDLRLGMTLLRQEGVQERLERSIGAPGRFI